MGKRIVFVCSNRSWGGSEELWSATAVSLAEAGHTITVFKPGLSRTLPRLQHLHNLGATLHDLGRLPLVPHAVHEFFGRLSYSAMFAQQLARLRLALARTPADLVIISQGVNHDAFRMASICRRMKLPYVLIIQKATELYWPADWQLERLRQIFSDALACYFVSEHNRKLTEEQLGIALPNAAIVRNPFLVPYDGRDDWPSDGDGLRLACVGRIYPMEKGQDLLLRVFAREQWRRRPLHLSFFGHGINDEGMKAMAKYYRLTNVTFHGFDDDVASIWRDHHGLLLGSRAEGLPLVLVEAMLCGRVPIVTAVAGNREVVDDNETGFLAPAPTEDAIDEALERAWERREEWRAIGARAAERIRTLVPRDPAAVFAGILLELATRGTDRNVCPTLVAASEP